jgi:hypothetical protein
MNDVIKKLAEQSGFYYTDKTGFITPAGCDPAKFAELIVRECAKICLEMATKCAGLPGEGALARDCAYYILKDFGVKE